MIGILNINKPKGMTSSDVVVKVRKILGTKAVGHFGTLDPMAEGVLPIGVGKATRLFDIMLKKNKTYCALFQFGYMTDTLDAQGKTVKSGGRIPCFSEITAACKKIEGKQSQVPPIYSAKSINGVRAYTLARSGVEVELKPSDIEIYSLQVKNTDFEDTYEFVVHCSSGTYIRSICRDLADSLDTYATMVSLKRLSCGSFNIEQSISLQELSVKGESALLDISRAIDSLPKITLDDNCYEYLLKGIKMESRGIEHELFSLYCKNELFGIAKINESDKIEIISYLRD